jgi:hypothetical protein
LKDSPAEAAELVREEVDALAPGMTLASMEVRAWFKAEP